MSRFHILTVTAIKRETRDAVVVTLTPRHEERDLFRFTQGQYLTFRRNFDNQELRRSYSICSGLDDGCLRVGIKRVDGGAFSTWANEQLALGDEIESMPPMGCFFTPLEPKKTRKYIAFAGGSGITPILSIVRTILSREPKSHVTLVYANRQISSIMFREELEDLKNIHLDRFSVLHVLEQDRQEADLFTGRINADKMRALFRLWLDVDSVNTAFICGPEPMMLTISASLREQGMCNEQIRFELFSSTQPGRAQGRAVSKTAIARGSGVEVAVTLDGVSRSFVMQGECWSILDAALQADMDVPYSCRAGVCSTCRCRILVGEVEMAVNHALEDYEVRAGYALSCQAKPLSKKIVVTFDD